MDDFNRRVLINMSNLHGGGGLQVAISFVNELLKLPLPDYRVKILISKEISESFDDERFLKSKWDFKTLDTYGLKTLLSSLPAIEKDHDIIFTLFGPKYTLNSSVIDIEGFAQPWIIYPNNPVFKRLPWYEKVRVRLRFFVQKLFFKRAKHLVVELDHVKESLVDKKVCGKESISIVHNSISSLYLDPKQWERVYLPRNANEIAIGFVTRDYPHKNISILAAVAKLLNEKYELPVRFYFTLTNEEWGNFREQFGEYGRTVGALRVTQCPRFYEQLDAVVFPSLLECFSATPLEALSMRVPLFASDRGFVKDVCAGYAIYFDPLNADDIARVIANYFLGDRKSDDELERARNYVLSFSSAEERAKRYLGIIEQYLEK
jgi:glycosyltransferase involved in cell wall biosynthesis